MSIGKYTYGTNNLIIHYSDSGSKLIIGNFCSIAGNINGAFWLDVSALLLNFRKKFVYVCEALV